MHKVGSSGTCRRWAKGPVPTLVDLPLEQHPPVPVVQRDPHDLPLGELSVDPDLPRDLLL